MFSLFPKKPLIGPTMIVLCSLVYMTGGVSLASASTSITDTSTSIISTITSLIQSDYQEKIGGRKALVALQKLQATPVYQQQQIQHLLDEATTLGIKTPITTGSCKDTRYTTITGMIANIYNIRYIYNTKQAGGEYIYCLQRRLYTSPQYQKSQLTAINAALSDISQIKQSVAQSVSTLSTAQRVSITKSMYTTGSTLDKADILLIEYTDLECPYCKRHHDNGTAQALLAKYPKTTYTIKHFPLSFHAKALSGAVAALCNAQNGKDYFSGIDSIFADLAFNPKPCPDTTSLVARVQAEIKEGQDVFNVTGTPASVLINTQTKAYRVIAGAYPLEAFIQAYIELLGTH